ncbi:MAG: hypothetical protein E7159_00570 [Firmicutes bacterium]|nr:hypothetical protein [Bacillota bacterium]
MLNNFDTPQDHGRSDEQLVKSTDARTLVEIWKTIHTSEEAKESLAPSVAKGLDYFVNRFVASTLPYMESDVIGHEESAFERYDKITNYDSPDYKRLTRERQYIDSVEEMYKESQPEKSK